MFTSGKLVAVLLLLLIPTLSTAALSNCPQEMPGMNNSRSQMADVRMASPQSSFAATGKNQCCEVSPAETVPALPARASTGNGTYAVPTAVAAIVATSLIAPTRTTCNQARISSPPPQALLCVFLI